MTGDLLRPKWLLAHLAVSVLAFGFIVLGLWQLDRHRERLIGNERGAARLAELPVPLNLLLDGDGDPDPIQFRRAIVEGVFDTESEVLVRSQVHLGEAGFHVVTPLVGEGGTAVLVNRGWVPLTLDRVPVVEASPPPGRVTVEGWVEPSRERPAFGPEDPSSGRLTVVNRVDIGRIQAQVAYPLAPVYVVQTGGEAGTLPEPVRPPDFDDAGPHLGYAIQWFGFALVGVVGYVFLIRRRRRSSQGTANARSSTTSKPG